MAEHKMKEINICVVGLGYVGLPLLTALSQHFQCYGYDVNADKISALRNGVDYTGELSNHEIACLNRARFGDDLKQFRDASVYIVTVPTPVDQNKVPDLSYVQEATKSIAKQLKKGDLVVYESTVYPGATEEICVPLLESISGLEINSGFSVGYSPERINPGDKNYKIKDIVKIISASNADSLQKMKQIYGSIVAAGLHCAPTIKVAEAAKIVENIQRDVNIALMNELSQIFAKLNVNIHDVIAAAQTKWNFMPFYPGLVGGHCIGVDPYYLVTQSTKMGYVPS